MVYVTHDQIEAMSLGHRIAILNKGRVEQIGTPLEVYDRPASLFCAAFIGSPPMNLIEVRGGRRARCTAAGGLVAHATGRACRATVAWSPASGRRRWRSPHRARNARCRPAWSRRSRWATRSSTWSTTAAQRDVRVRMPPTVRFAADAPVGLRHTGGTPPVYDASTEELVA